RLPSGLNATLQTGLVCPWRESCSWPFCASHTFTSPGLLLQESPPAEAMCLPSGLKHTLVTLPMCPLRERRSSLVCASHTFTVRSSLPEAMRWPSGRGRGGSPALARLATQPVECVGRGETPADGKPKGKTVSDKRFSPTEVYPPCPIRRGRSIP